MNHGDPTTSQSTAHNGAHNPPTPRPRATSRVCPYCGETLSDPNRCAACRGMLDPLSRQATQNAMGAWFVRDPANPFRPGCSYQTLRRWVQRGRIGPGAVVRGPTTRQFWTTAERAPGLGHLFGRCHSCAASVEPDDESCARCGASFAVTHQRDDLGLAPVHLLPGHSRPEEIAAMSLSGHSGVQPGGRKASSERRPSRIAPAESGSQSPPAPASGQTSERDAARTKKWKLAAAVLAAVCVGLSAALIAVALGVGA